MADPATPTPTPLTSDAIVTAVNNANTRLAAAGLPPLSAADFETFLARSFAQMAAVAADAAAQAAVTAAQAASATAQATAQALSQQAQDVRAKIATV
jgi:hypothetical protein